MRNFKSIKPHHIEFAKLYSLTNSSLDSFIKSHRHILKVEASNLLVSNDIWEYIIKYKKSNEVKSAYDETVAACYDKVLRCCKKSPFVICDKMTKGYAKHKIADPLEVIRYLAFAHYFFVILQRDFFIKKIEQGIKLEMGYINTLREKNSKWDIEISRLAKKLQDEHINLLNIIECQEEIKI